MISEKKQNVQLEIEAKGTIQKYEKCVDQSFLCIAGYTSNGAPYGFTREVISEKKRYISKDDEFPFFLRS